MKKIISLMLVFVMLLSSSAQHIQVYAGTEDLLVDKEFQPSTSGELDYTTFEETLTPDEQAVQDDYDWLIGETVIHYGIYRDDIRSNINLPTEGELGGSTITWTSSDEKWIMVDGTVTRPPFSINFGNVAVNLVATITKGTATLEKAFELEVVAEYPTSEDNVAADKSILTYDRIRNSNDVNDVKTRLSLPTQMETRWSPSGYYGGSNIEWVSSNPAVIGIDGTVTRPEVVDGNQEVTLTATISYGEAIDTKTFQFNVTVIEEFPLSINYDNFTETDLQFNGVSGTVGTIDRDGNSITALNFNNDRTLEPSGGSIFTNKKIRLGEDFSFSTTFTYKNPHPDFTTGEGGFVFTLQAKENTIYSETLNDTNNKPSLNIGFITDYYKGAGYGQETSYNSRDIAAVYYNGDYTNVATQTMTSASTNDPATYNQAWIEYNGTTKILEVRVSKDGLRPISSNLTIEDLALGDILTSAEVGLGTEDVREVYVGFMGSMGNAKDKSEIQSLYFKNESTPIDFAPYRFIDASKVDLSATYPTGQSSTPVTATVYGVNGPVEGMRIDFSTTLGTLDSAYGITDETGKVSVVLSSSIAGTAVVKAHVPGGTLSIVEVQLVLSEEDKLNFDFDWLTVDFIRGTNDNLSNIIHNLSLPVAAPNGSIISWGSSDISLVNVDGAVTRPSIEQLNRETTLTATLSIGDKTMQKIFSVTVKVRDEDLAGADEIWLTQEIILNENVSLNEIKLSLTLPTIGHNGSVINWSSDKIGVVATNGVVNRPSFKQGDQSVILTATITMGEVTLTKTFELIVIALMITDEEATYLDHEWLSEDVILNGNNNLDNIESDLELPRIGLNGSEITWESTREEFAGIDGTINRPNYGQGPQMVTLTATIKKGTVSYSKAFFIKVSYLATDAEVVLLDKRWITYNMFYSITTDIDLPTLGEYGSIISWSSSNEAVIKPDGTVKIPSYLEGVKVVDLTAKIVKGSMVEEKRFSFLVRTLDLTDEERVFDDTRRLLMSQTLGENLSEYSINQDILLPTVGYNGSSITWNSDNSVVITNTGLVTIPEYSEGHKKVRMTATFTKGEAVTSRSYYYTVLSKSDTYSPVVKEIAPTSGSVNVLWNTKVITITFDEEIATVTSVAELENYGIILNGLDTPDYTVSIVKNKLTINLMDYLTSEGVYELVVPSNTITDRKNNYINEEIKASFQVEEKINRRIEVINSLPSHKDGNVTTELKQVSFQFNYSDISKGSNFEAIALLDMMGNKINVTKSMVGDTITLTLDSNNILEKGSVYEIFIPTDAVMDRYENRSIGQSIKFITETSEILPSITSYYPYNGQTGVGIDQRIRITFSEAMKAADSDIVILDDQGNKLRAWIDNAEKNVLSIHVPYDIKPNRRYTVKGSYQDLSDNSSVGFETSFTTGGNELYIKTGPLMSQLPLNTPIEITFSAPILEGDFYSNIKIIDSIKDEVDFEKRIENNKLILTTKEPLNASDLYEIFVPKGAVKNSDNKENDEKLYWCRTARPINFGSDTFRMPSTWVTENVFTMDASWLGRLSYPLKSIHWDFGDGKKVSGTLNPATVYWNPGDYKVTLTLVDSGDISYVFERTITINRFDLVDAKLSVYRETWNPIIAEKDNPYGLTNRMRFDVALYSPTIGYISNQRIHVSLYKNGTFVENLGSVQTKGNQEAQFYFDYGNKGYYGTYEVVFTDTNNKQVRIPIYFTELTQKQSMSIYLINYDDYTFLADKKDQYFDLNGVKTLGKYEKMYEGTECYVIEGLETGVSYTLQLSNSVDYPYASEEISVHHEGSDYPIYLGARKKEPGLNSISSAVSDSYFERGLFIRNVSIPDLSFELHGDWDNLIPGYYELKSSQGSISLKSEKPIFKLQPGLEMHVGEELFGRMVAKNGATSPWYSADFAVAPYPTLGYGPKLDISYRNGKYEVDAALSLGGLTGGGLDILDGVPLLDSSNGFGLGGSSNRFNGYITNRGDMYLNSSYSAGHGMSTKKNKMITTGYEVSADIRFNGHLIYDGKEWSLNYYYYNLLGRGSYFWKRDYKIPKIGIGGWGKVTMGANIDGKLKIEGGENNSRDFKGILEFEPYVSISIGAGIEGKLSVEGYVTGSVPAEFHIPTGYIQVEPNIQAKIMVYYIFDSSTVYSKEIVRTHWDNGKEKVVLFSRNFAADIEEGIKLTPTSRGYLNKDSTWLAGGFEKERSFITTFGVDTTSTIDSRSNILVMTENIYPRAEVQLVNSDKEQWLVWTEDNPVRDDNNRTQLRYTVYREGIWENAAWFEHDNTADFSPTMATVSDGLLLAWQNINTLMTEETKYESYIKNSEISVTNGVYKGEGTEPSVITLTKDDKFDHSPMLVTDNGKAVLVWTKSEGLALTFGEDMKYLQAPEHSDSLYSSFWDGSTWSTAMEIEGSMPDIIDSSLEIHGEEAILLYTLDMDQDPLTQEDREVYYRILQGTSWGEAIRLSNNDIEDSAAKAVNVNGEWFIVWQQNGVMMYQTALGTEAKTEEALLSIPNNYEIAVMEGEHPQIAIVYLNSNLDSTTSLVTTFYDIDKEIWSDSILLSESKNFIRSFSPTFTKDGTLEVVYTQAEMITEVVDQVELFVPSDKVDLVLLSYTPKHDLAINEEIGVLLDPSIPIKGTVSTVSVMVENKGDFAEHATLSLYDGKGPEGKLIGEVTTSKAIPAQSMTLLEIDWLVGLEERNEYELYAVVQPEPGIQDETEDNNELRITIKTTDISVTELECNNIQGDNYLTRARIENVGSKSLVDIKVELVNEANGQIIETRMVNELLIGQKGDCNFLFSSKDLTKGEDGKINLYVRVSLTHSEEEYSTENNEYHFTLEPATINIQRIDPIQNGTQISVESPFTIGFNMNVEQGLEFDQIELLDDALNEIEIDKTLNGRTLTITPQNPLSYGTAYTLMLPNEAVTDSYGHKMEEAYTLNFATTLSSPEVIFAYPGNNMTDVALDSEIMVQFNQEIISDLAYADIALYRSDSTKASVSTSVKGEWMYINLAKKLCEDTEYTLIIPKGAVKNAKEEMLRDDYVLIFNTKGLEENPITPVTPEEEETNSDSEQVKYTITTDENGAMNITIMEQEGVQTPFVVSIPYTPTTEELQNPECLIIHYFDESGKLILIPNGHYDTTTKNLVFRATQFGRYIVSFNQVNFDDVSADDWYSKAVNFIAARGITAGTGDGNYSPQVRLKRSDFLVLLMRAYNVAPDSNPADNFTDCGNTYYTDYLATAKRLGITQGVGNNMFAPEREITRQEMFVLLYNTLKSINKLPNKSSDKGLNDFADVEMIDSWARNALSLLIEAGIINGSEGKLLPTSTATRAEMAQVLYNLLTRALLE